MSFKDAIDNIAKNVTDAIGNAKDSASEAGHRSAAEAEAAKRDLAGDHQSLSEKAGSVINQAKHETLAAVDSAKQDARDTT